MYILKVAGIRFLRFLVPVVLKLTAPKPSSAPPTPSLKLHLTTKSKRRVLIHIYHSSSSAVGSKKSKTSPAIVNLHGSGFCFHTFGEDASFCQMLADRLDAVVFDVNYSHAPENPFPAASEDVDAVLSWLQQGRISAEVQNALIEPSQETSARASQLVWDPSQIALTGFSSGGNLVLTACVRAHERGDGSIKNVVALYPSTDLAESPYSKPKVGPAKGAAGGVLPPQLRHFLYACYLSPSQERADPRVSPIYAPPHAFPSTTIITCEGDSLAREARKMAKKLQEAGRDVQHYEARGQGHGWDKMTKQGTEPAKLKDEAYELAVARLQKTFATSAAS